MSGRFDLPELRARLTERMDTLAEALIGEPPNKALSTPHELRFYRKGGLSVVLTGRKRGGWFDHAAEEGGGPLDLVMHVRRTGFAEAVNWAASWCGLPPNAPTERGADMLRERQSRRQRLEVEEAAARAARLKRGRQFAREIEPLPGSVADSYLVKTRCIPPPRAGWPECIGFHRRTRSLVLVATLPDGNVAGVQRVRLTPAAQKVADGQPPKISNGVFENAAVRLPGDPTGPLLIAEGPETGLSVWAATGYETWIALGGLAKLILPNKRLIVACRDDDPPQSPADKALSRALTIWRAAGASVVVATPWSTLRGDRSDLNDTIRAGGPNAVGARIARALQPSEARQRNVSVKQARRTLREANERFFADTAEFCNPKGTVKAKRDPAEWVEEAARDLGGPPPVHGVKGQRRDRQVVPGARRICTPPTRHARAR